MQLCLSLTAYWKYYCELVYKPEIPLDTDTGLTTVIHLPYFLYFYLINHFTWLMVNIFPHSVDMMVTLNVKSQYIRRSESTRVLDSTLLLWSDLYRLVVKELVTERKHGETFKYGKYQKIHYNSNVFKWKDMLLYSILLFY